MPLTDVAIRALKPGPKLVRKSDGGGLYIEVSPAGRKTWRLSYRFRGSQKTMVIGLYPEMRLSEARYAREMAKAELRAGRDPRPALQPPEPEPVDPGVPEERTWRRVQADYLMKRRLEGAAEATLAKLRLHADLLDATFGDRDIATIKAPDVLRACRVYEQQGRLNSSQAVRILASQVFRFAIAQGLAEYDAASMARGALARPRVSHHAAVTDPREVGELMRAIRASAGSPQSRVGLLLSAYLFPRNLQLREMRWADIDGDLWIVPAEHMKMKREHLVPLPRQAKEVLDWIRPLTGREERVLHSFTAHNGLMSENTLNKALDVLGFDKTRHRQHGFRTTFSTTMHEQGWRSEWIETQLAHVDENKVRAVYNRALYLENRSRMMQAYADWLDGCAAQTDR